MDDQPVQDLALNAPNIFQADDCDAFESDVDDEPTTQTIFMANLSSAVSSSQQSGPSNASIISEVLKLYDTYNMVDEQKIPNKLQQTDVVESDTVDMGNSNIISNEQYVNHNNVSDVLGCASSVVENASVIDNACELHENTVFIPDDTLTTRLNIYKDQVAIYEQRAKFELTEREQKMDCQMRTFVTEHNLRDETLKRELDSLRT